MSDQKRVLLVDDDREIIHGVSLRLRTAGFETLCAHDGAQGLGLAMEHLPDAIVMDLRMPVMDGWALLTQLKENAGTRSIPAIVLSASAQDEVEKRALDLGACFFLEKPYDAVKLVESVKAAMAQTGGTRSPRRAD